MHEVYAERDAHRRDDFSGKVRFIYGTLDSVVAPLRELLKAQRAEDVSERGHILEMEIAEIKLEYLERYPELSTGHAAECQTRIGEARDRCHARKLRVEQNGTEGAAMLPDMLPTPPIENAVRLAAPLAVAVDHPCVITGNTCEATNVAGANSGNIFKVASSEMGASSQIPPAKEPGSMSIKELKAELQGVNLAGCCEKADLVAKLLEKRQQEGDAPLTQLPQWRKTRL
jgi:hypothetical protein